MRAAKKGMIEGQPPLADQKWWSRGYGDAAERKHDRDIQEQIQLALKRGLRMDTDIRMDTDKFKNDLMIGETSSIEFKRFEMACLVVKHPVKVRYDT